MERGICPLQNMHQQRSDFGITYDSNQKTIYVMGGIDKVCLNHCERYSIKDNKWTAIRPINQAWSGASACMQGEQFIYLIGGYGGDLNDFKPINTIEQYDIYKDNWTTITIG